MKSVSEQLLNLKLTAVGLPQKSNSSMGSWAIAVDFIWPNGMKANTWEYTWSKKEALAKYNELLKRI